MKYSPDLILVLQFCLSSAWSSQHSNRVKENVQLKGVEVACIDDSDCAQLGHKFVCYLFSCINWLDHTPCGGGGDLQCPESHQCYSVSNWLEETRICVARPRPCTQHSDCGAIGEPHLCCKDSCCPLTFFQQWTQFSCVTDEQCQDWKTGESCCEGGRCCDSPVTTPGYSRTTIISSTETFYKGDYNLSLTEDTTTTTSQSDSRLSQVVSSLPLKNTSSGVLVAKNSEVLTVTSLLLLTFRPCWY